MATHTVELVQVPVLNGTVIINPTIGQKLNSTSETRVNPKAGVPNSAGHPTIEDYLADEDSDGFKLLHIDQTFIVTSTADTLVIEQINDDSVALSKGTPVFVSSAGNIQRAQADAAGTSGVIGLILSPSITISSPGSIQLGGLITATADEWDSVTGGSGGLTTGSMYFLSAATAGRLTTTAPAVPGQFVVAIGRAIGTTQLMINIANPIAL